MKKVRDKTIILVKHTIILVKHMKRLPAIVTRNSLSVKWYLF